MLELLFGNQNTEHVLFFLLKNDTCYATQLSKRFDSAVNGIQKTLQKLEKANILVSYFSGKTRLYQFNPRYPFLSELISFLKKAYSYLPQHYQTTYYEPIERKRPRRTGKPL